MLYKRQKATMFYLIKGRIKDLSRDRRAWHAIKVIK
jgi:hypothetical protein